MPRSTSAILALATFRFTLTLAVLLSASTLVFAQDTVTGAFEGTVTDSLTGNPLKDAAVEIINQQTNVTISLKTDYRGRFFQGNLLLPGTYVVRVSLSGYVTKAAVQLLKITYTGEVVPVPVALDPAPAGTTPTPPATVAPIPAETNDIRATIITSDGRRSGSYSSTEVVSLPVGALTTTRTFDELALLLPGVAPPPQTLGSVAGPGVGAGVGSAGQFAVNGIRSRANNFTVDGSDNNDEDIGVRRQGFVALIPQPLESIQEYQVITLLAPAQFGRNIGGQVNAVSKSGGSQVHGTAWGRFNSSQLNARNFFDTAFGSATSVVRANNQDVLVQTRNGAGVVTSQRTLNVTNESGEEDSFTLFQGGLVVGGPISKKTFYYFSVERNVVNASEEHSFAVPTIEQRGAFGTGTTGIFTDPFTAAPTATLPVTSGGSALLSLFPFPNNPAGVYGVNTLTHVLPASARGTIFSGKVDHNFKISGREQSVTNRYNFTDDWRNVPVTDSAIFSTLKPQVRTQNFSFFFNSKLSSPESGTSVFNQFRLSYGRTTLIFDEVRDTARLLPSNAFPNSPFMLNRRSLLNITTPPAAGVANTGQIVYVQQPITTEQQIGPLGQVIISGFSSLGVDVLNFPQRRVNNTYQVADNLTVRHRDHNFTFGLDVRRSELNSNLPRNNRTLATFNGSPRLVFENGAFRFPITSDLNQFMRGIDLAAMGAASNSYMTLITNGNDDISLKYYQFNFFASDEWRISRRWSVSLGLRYEYNTPVRELNNRIESTFTDPALALVPGLNQFINGRTTIYDSDRNNLAPRIGVAYSPKLFGPNKVTVIRGGFGIYYDQILGAVVSQSRNVYPTFLTLNFGGLNASSAITPLNFFNPARTILPTPAGGFATLVQPGTQNRLNPAHSLPSLITQLNISFPDALGATIPERNLAMPSAMHYDLMLEQQLTRDMVLSIAYVGTRARNLLRFNTPNLGPASTIVPDSFGVFVDLGLPNPVIQGRVRPPTRSVAGVGAINQFETSADSVFNSLQIQLRGRLNRWFSYQTNYTYSHANDDVSDVFDLAGAPALPQNSLTFAGERGPANFDSRHRGAYAVMYEVPSAGPTAGMFRKLANGIELSSTGRMSSGQPFTVNSVFDVNLDGNLTDRLDSTGGLVESGSSQQPLILVGPTAQMLAPVGSDGRVGRNTFRAGGTMLFDVAASKRFSFTNSQSLSFRVEVFNFLNRANFGVPVRYLEAPAFGSSTNTTTPGRRVQLSLKYLF